MNQIIILMYTPGHALYLIARIRLRALFLTTECSVVAYMQGQSFRMKLCRLVYNLLTFVF